MDNQIFLYTVTSATTGLVQPPDKIVVRFAQTIYPFSLGGILSLPSCKYESEHIEKEPSNILYDVYWPDYSADNTPPSAKESSAGKSSKYFRRA